MAFGASPHRDHAEASGAPIIGGMITALLLSLFVLPAIYKLLGFKKFIPRLAAKPLTASWEQQSRN